MAVVLGWFGALPGFVAVMLYGPVREHGVPLMPFGDLIRGFGGMFLAYMVFALPLFGPFMFLMGLVGGALINRYSQPPAPRWVQQAAIIATSAVTAIPIALLDERLAPVAIATAAFWAATLLLARKALFAARP